LSDWQVSAMNRWILRGLATAAFTGGAWLLGTTNAYAHNAYAHNAYAHNAHAHNILTENTYTPGADHATLAGHRASVNVDLRLALMVNRGGPAQHRVPAAPAAGTVTVGRRSGAPAA